MINWIKGIYSISTTLYLHKTKSIRKSSALFQCNLFDVKPTRAFCLNFPGGGGANKGGKVFTLAWWRIELSYKVLNRFNNSAGLGLRRIWKKLLFLVYSAMYHRSFTLWDTKFFSWADLQKKDITMKKKREGKFHFVTSSFFCIYPIASQLIATTCLSIYYLF